MVIVFTATEWMHDQRWHGYFSSSVPSPLSLFLSVSFVLFLLSNGLREDETTGSSFWSTQAILYVSLLSPSGRFFSFLNVLFLKPDRPFPAHFSRYLFYLSVLKETQVVGGFVCCNLIRNTWEATEETSNDKNDTETSWSKQYQAMFTIGCQEQPQAESLHFDWSRHFGSELDA